MNNKIELNRKVAHLESRLDQVETELEYLNTLLLHSGFPEGVKTLKTTIEQLLGEAGHPYQLPTDDYPPTQTSDPFV